MNSDEAIMVDSLNMQSLLKLINKYGYPSEKIIGKASAFNAYIMLLHMDRDENNIVFKSILDKAYNDGYHWPRGLAWIVDRRRYWEKVTAFKPLIFCLVDYPYNS